ncbi:AI-2E family transporter [Streptomyces sp. NPDC046161]|uniref:AI-2E family transporter n=1 Tax=Streptomyces sp. NPDC046161 TaxID=3155132 RepID=UPI0033C20BB4
MPRRSTARPARRDTDETRARIRTAARRARGRHPDPGPSAVAPLLVTLAGYAWRILVLAAFAYAIFVVLGRFHEVAVAVFLGLVVTAMLRPLADLLARWVPRPLAVACALIGSIVLVLGILAFVGETVASEWDSLVTEFKDGLARIQPWLERPPLRLNADALSDAQARIGEYLSSHRSDIVNTAVTGAGRLVEVLTVAALALFCSVFFIHSGDRHWQWFCGQLPAGARHRVAVVGRAAWSTFTGYTRGIVLVAGTNAILVGVALLVLRVPLALPLALLEFVAAFIPLIGSPVALAVAAIIALATRGPLIAGLVIVLIVVIGQIEGHLLHPLVMSWAVRLHPVIVALSVIAGAIAAGVVGAVVAVPLVSVLWSAGQALRSTAPT